MCELEELEPKEVFYYFRKISEIPRGSGNLDGIRKFCFDVANEHNINCKRDDYGNVVIYCDGTSGYESSETVIIQGHLDMVCEKTDCCNIDMSQDGLKLETDGEYLWADKTTLGGDDGIAIAYAFALLDSNAPHPPLEILLTADEEVGLVGAENFDSSLVNGKKLINIDSEKEGIITVSCAGGVRAKCCVPVKMCEVNKGTDFLKLSVGGLRGGHSGVDINKSRKNAIRVMGELLEYLTAENDFSICSFDGGTKENVIPNYCECVVGTSCSESLKKSVEKYREMLFERCGNVETNLYVTAETTQPCEKYADKSSRDKIIFTLVNMPEGVQEMNGEMENMVQTSLNAGTVEMKNEMLTIGFLLRSNNTASKEQLRRKVVNFFEYVGGSVEFRSDYPVWDYRSNSPLRDIMVSAYEECYGEKPQVCGVHAGLECGILSGKIPHSDMVSFGPDIENVHTPDERMSVASVQRCYDYLKAVLKKCK